MPHATWKGSLSFGLVQLPIELYTAERRDDLSFEMVDRRDMAPIGYSKVNKKTGEKVPKEEIVKAHEVGPGRVVVVEDEDFKRVKLDATHVIDISEFVEASRIPPYFFERPYYAAPAKGGEKPYRLLVAALAESGRVGIGQIVMHARESVVAVYPEDDVLVVNTLRYVHELRDTNDLKLPSKEQKPAERELTMAKRLIEDMAGSWKPSQYKDQYRDDLLELIRRKAKTGTKGLPPPEEPAAPRKERSVDLGELLRRSLEHRRRNGAHPSARSVRGEKLPGTVRSLRTGPSRSRARRATGAGR
jgi:DNA end-binding protein Ku